MDLKAGNPVNLTKVIRNADMTMARQSMAGTEEAEVATSVLGH